MIWAMTWAKRWNEMAFIRKAPILSIRRHKSGISLSSMLVLVSIIGLGNGSCSPIKNVYYKEKIKETHAEPPPGFQVDTFKFNHAFGNVDVLFVVDNTDALHTSFSNHPSRQALNFLPHYQQFLNKWADPAVRELNFSIQLITSPNDQVSSHIIQKVGDIANHVQEMFTNMPPYTPAFPKPFLVNFNESGRPRAYHSTIVGLNSMGRARNSLFVVYVLGDDITPDIEEENSAFSNKFKEKYGFFQTQFWLLANKDPTKTIGTAACPVAHPSNFISNISGLPNQSNFPARQIDLCDPNWGDFKDTLFTEIVNEKKKYVLSQGPYQYESTMKVNTVNRILRRGSDYEYKSDTNSIEFTPTAGLQDGDIFYVNYYVTPPKELLPGGKGPSGPP